MKDVVLKKYTDTYAEKNIYFKGRWKDPLEITKKIKKKKRIKANDSVATHILFEENSESEIDDLD